MASARDWPQISGSGWKAPQMRGRSGCPKILQRKSSVRLTQRTPAGLPLGIPGIGELIEITVQQAAHLGRHSIIMFSGWGKLTLNTFSTLLKQSFTAAKNKSLP